MKLDDEQARLRVLGIAGSLREASYNKKLVRAARTLAPEGMEVVPFDLAPLPLFNADVEAEGDPPAVTAFKEAIRAADALLIATPEYNHGIPGVLKNAVDWASRGGGASPLREKAVAILGASAGRWGTVRAQEHLRQVLAACGAYVLPRPSVLVGRAGEQFDETGALSDASTRERVRRLLEALAEWHARFQVDLPVGV